MTDWLDPLVLSTLALVLATVVAMGGLIVATLILARYTRRLGDIERQRRRVESLRAAYEEARQKADLAEEILKLDPIGKDEADRIETGNPQESYWWPLRRLDPLIDYHEDRSIAQTDVKDLLRLFSGLMDVKNDRQAVARAFREKWPRFVEGVRASYLTWKIHVQDFAFKLRAESRDVLGTEYALRYAEP